MEISTARIHQHPTASRAAILIVATVLITAMFAIPYIRADTQVSAPSNLSVLSINTTGQNLNGYYTLLGTSNAPMQTAFTPTLFSLTPTQTYTLTMDNFGSCTFQGFENGQPNGATIYPTGGPMQMVAIYNCLTTTVTIQAVDQLGNPISGYFVTLSQNGNIYAASFTPTTITVFTNQAYAIQAESFGSCTFVNWQGSAAGDTIATFTASGQGQTYTAVYDCGNT